MIDPVTGAFIGGAFAAARHFKQEEQLEDAYRRGQQGDSMLAAPPLSCLDVTSAAAGSIEYATCEEYSAEDIEDRLMDR